MGKKTTNQSPQRSYCVREEKKPRTNKGDSDKNLQVENNYTKTNKKAPNQKTQKRKTDNKKIQLSSDLRQDKTTKTNESGLEHQ